MRTHHPRHATPAKHGSSTPTRAVRLVAAPGDKRHDGRPVCADDIRLRAYEKWERAGKPPGDGVRFWLEAEQELMHGT